jgi:hypothetical protein
MKSRRNFLKNIGAGLVATSVSAVIPVNADADPLNTKLSSFKKGVTYKSNGSRVEYNGKQARVYDANNVMRVRLGIW